MEVMMKDHILIGCDIGTSGTKAVAVDRKGKLLAQSYKSYGIWQLKTKWAEQDISVWLDAAMETIREVVTQVRESDISSICISALYGGTGVLCDADMNAIRPALIWMDRRAEKEALDLKRSIGEDKMIEISGNGIDSYYGYVKLKWIQNHEPEIWKQIKYIIPVHSYIVYKMTGIRSIDYSSAGNLGGIYNYIRHCWDEDMCRELGIEIQSLPDKFVKPSDIIGTIQPEYQKRLGLHHDVNLCAGTVDCIAAMLSASVTDIGDSAAVLGTSLNWGFLHDKLPDNANLVSMPYCTEPEKISYTYGGASTAGALPRWFANNFMEGEEQSAYKKLEQDIYEHNIGAGSDGLVILPYFMGERTPIWDENAKGVIYGLTLSHTKAHIYRAILESVAYSLRDIMNSMIVGDTVIDKIILVGGGTKSKLWKHIFADVTGFPVYTPVKEVEAPLGDAFLAGIGMGLFHEYSEIKEWITFHKPVLPNKENHIKYSKYFRIYKELYGNLKVTMKKTVDLLD